MLSNGVINVPLYTFLKCHWTPILACETIIANGDVRIYARRWYFLIPNKMSTYFET